MNTTRPAPLFSICHARVERRSLTSHCRLCSIFAYVAHHRALDVISLKLSIAQSHTLSDKQGGPRRDKGNRILGIGQGAAGARTPILEETCRATVEETSGYLHAMRPFPFQIEGTRDSRAPSIGMPSHLHHLTCIHAISLAYRLQARRYR